MNIHLTSGLDVTLIAHHGNDADIANAARVSTGADGQHDTHTDERLINYLVKNRHGSPFEHTYLKFKISAPIFVFREFMRHRIGFSYNEASARYKKLEPKFYVYPEQRPLVQEGSSAHPDLVMGDGTLSVITRGLLTSSYAKTWKDYEALLDAGVANEVARAVLPVGVYSDMIVSCNVRSLMAFLSLRVDSPDNTFETKPQWEIQQVAEDMEFAFKTLFPATHKAFVNNGRVCP